MGFVDLGKVDQELDQLTRSIDSCDEQIQPHEQQAAEHMFVLMIRTVFKPSFSFPVVQYPTTHLSGDKLYSIMWEVIERLELHGLNVVTVTSDGAAPNRRFYRLCALEEVSGDVVYKTKNPFRRGQDIYFICDCTSSS